MMWYTTIVSLLTLAVVFAAPANNDLLDKDIKFKSGGIVDKETIRTYRKIGYFLDKATVNDVAVNSVSEEKKVQVRAQSQTESAASPTPSAPSSSIQITGITTGADSPVPSLSDDGSPFRPQRVGSMFARFIDDIFQIPISVLQNVARLITSPFNSQKKTPEVVATVS